MDTPRNSMLDLRQIKNLQEVFHEGLKEFMEVYYKDFENNQNKLAIALQNKNADDIAKLGHAMKGSSLNVGARSIADICSKIESAGKDGNVATAEQEFATLKTVYMRSKEEFNKLFN